MLLHGDVLLELSGSCPLFNPGLPNPCCVIPSPLYTLLTALAYVTSDSVTPVSLRPDAFIKIHFPRPQWQNVHCSSLSENMSYRVLNFFFNS